MTDLDPTEPITSTTSEPLVDVDTITPDETLLADVHRTRLTTPVTRVLLALVVIAGAFLAGALVERTQHKSSNAASGLQAIAAQFRNRLGNPGATGGSSGQGVGGGGNGTTIGTVKLVDGNTVYVQDFSGNVIRVTTNGSTTVDLTTKGKVGQLKQGSSVIVQGTPSSDGTSTAATSISQSSGLGTGSPFGGSGPGAGTGAPSGG